MNFTCIINLLLLCFVFDVSYLSMSILKNIGNSKPRISISNEDDKNPFFDETINPKPSKRTTNNKISFLKDIALKAMNTTKTRNKQYSRLKIHTKVWGSVASKA